VLDFITSKASLFEGLSELDELRQSSMKIDHSALVRLRSVRPSGGTLLQKRANLLYCGLITLNAIGLLFFVGYLDHS